MSPYSVILLYLLIFLDQKWSLLAEKSNQSLVTNDIFRSRIQLKRILPNQLFCQNKGKIFLDDLMKDQEIPKWTFKKAGFKENPCCFPDVWESHFHVWRRAYGYTPKLDFSSIRVNSSDEKNITAVLIRGQDFAYTSLCGENEGGKLPGICPTDRLKCLEAPYPGNPRCVGHETGFQRSEVKIKKSGVVIETWFTDIAVKRGGVERHIVIFKRFYGLCQLKSYEVIYGQYLSQRRTCRMFERTQFFYKPLPQTFKLNFNHNILQDLLLCNGK